MISNIGTGYLQSHFKTLHLSHTISVTYYLYNLLAVDIIDVISGIF